MFLAYTAGPIRSSKGFYHVEQNIRKAECVAIELWKLGFAVICPHLNTRHLDGCLVEGDKTDMWKDSFVWLEGDFEMLRRCDLIVMLEGWEKSTGATAEYEYAISLNMPVYYWEKDRDRILLKEIGTGANKQFKKRV